MARVFFIIEELSLAPTANKVSGGWSFYSSLNELEINRGQETIERIVEAMSYPATASIYIYTDAGNADIYPTNAGFLSINKHSAVRSSVKFLDRNGLLEWNGDYYGDRIPKWQGWTQLGIAVQSVYDLPINTGNVSKNGVCEFSKNSLNSVKIDIDIKPDSKGVGRISNGILVASVPVGFRPSESRRFPAVLTSSEGKRIGFFEIASDGHIRVYHTESEVTEAFGSVSFYVV